jgi:hypothetical protein
MLAARVRILVVTCLLAAAPARAEAPVAEAGLGLLAYVDDTVELNGTGSADADGDALTYAWTQVGGPTVALEGADTAQPRFTVEQPGTLTFQLVVNDGTSDSAPDEVSVAVPYRAIDGVASGGCNVVPGSVSSAGLLVLTCLVARRRR